MTEATENADATPPFRHGKCTLCQGDAYCEICGDLVGHRDKEDGTCSKKCPRCAKYLEALPEGYLGYLLDVIDIHIDAALHKHNSENKHRSRFEP